MSEEIRIREAEQGDELNPTFQPITHFQPLPGLYQAEDHALSFIGKPMTALAVARTRGTIKTNEITSVDTMTIRDEVEIISKKARSLGVGEGKLLSVAVSAFTKRNAQNTSKPQLRVSIDTKDYAIANKKEIFPRKMGSDAEQAREDKRAAKALENFVAKVAKNAENLKSNMTFSWKEKLRGKVQSYNGISFISAYRVNKDTITLEVSQSAAEIITTWALADRPRSYYAIDDKRSNAFAIADALIAHYTNENNVIKDSERMMNIGTLIRKYTSFPSYEELKAKELGWEHFVKEQFETALDHLHNIGLLADWKYSRAGKEILSDDEAGMIYTYDQFTALYLYFELSGYEDHDQRRKAIFEKRKEKEEASREKKRRRKARQNEKKQAEEQSGAQS